MVVRRLLLLFLAVASLTAATPPGKPHSDWLQFQSAPPPAAITRDTVDDIHLRWHISTPEKVDGSPLYVDGVPTATGTRDMLIVETIGGQVCAYDAHDGTLLWKTGRPPGPRWTTSSPAIDPARRWVYAYALDGYVHKYALVDGKEFTGNGWPQLITLKGAVEKGSSAITIVTTKSGANYLYMPVAAYPDPGDDGDYQGHLVTVNLDSGEQYVFNALCSDRTFHFTDHGDETDCANRQAGIWARAGAVYDASLDRIFVSVGNGTYDANSGGFNWGSSLVALRPDGTTDNGTPLDAYTPVDYQRLTDEDLDLSSSNIEILPLANHPSLHLGVLIGKDGVLRLLNLADLSGQGGPRHLGGELQKVDILGNHEVMSRSLAWLNPDTKQTWVFIASTRGICGLSLDFDADGVPSLTMRWQRQRLTTTSPIVTGGALFGAADGAIVALDPATGTTLWRERAIGNVHWQTPIVTEGGLYIADENGTLYCFGGEPKKAPPGNNERAKPR